MYEWDVFVSYLRSRGSAGDWVLRCFVPELKRALEDLTPLEPRVFLDTDLRTGEEWPLRLQQVLARSKLLVPILNAPYFDSEWCMTELETIRQRQLLLAASSAGTTTLIHPVRLADGEHFPDWIQRLQWADMAHLNYTNDYFRESSLFLEFQRSVRELAATLVASMEAAPDFDPDFPVVENAELIPTPIQPLPRLHG